MFKKFLLLNFLLVFNLFSSSLLNKEIIYKITNLKDENNFFIEKNGYIVSYNTNFKIANFVIYYLNITNLKQSQEINLKRKFYFFYTSSKINYKYKIYNKDYKNTGYDKGHLANAKDLSYSENSFRDSFDLINIVPQHPSLNRQQWKWIEQYVRYKIQYKTNAIIITGIIMSNYYSINRLYIPDKFYKIVFFSNDDFMVFEADNKYYHRKESIKKFFSSTNTLYPQIKVNYHQLLFGE